MIYNKFLKTPLVGVFKLISTHSKVFIHGGIIFFLVLPFLLGLYHTYITGEGIFFLNSDIEDASRNISETGIAVLSAFVSAVLAMSIPISLNVISNVDTKYQLNVLTTSFVKEAVFLTLLYALFFNAFLLIFNLLGSNEIYEYSAFIISGLSLIILALYIQKIITYSSSLKLKLYLFKRIDKRISTFIKTNKDKHLEEIILINEKLCGIAINEIKTGDYVGAKNTLEQISQDFERMIIGENIDIKLLTKVCQYKNIVAEEKSESKTFLDTYLSSVYDFWKEAYLNERSDLSALPVQQLEKILLECLVNEKYKLVITSILNTFLSIVNYSSRKETKEVDYSVNRASFYWFDSYLHKIKQNKEVLPTSFDQEFNHLKSYLWFNLKVIIQNDRVDLLQLYFKQIFNGYILNLSNGPYIHYSLKQLHEKLNSLELGIRDVKKFKEFQVWLKNCNNWCAMLESSIGTPEFEKLSLKIDDFKNGGLNFLLFHKQREFVSALASLALYSKKYSVINLLWSYRQPGDSIAINGGNDILPNNLMDVFKVYIDSHNIPFFTYPLEDNHDIEVYMRKYAVLLFLRQYTLPSYLITDRFLEVNYIPGNLKHEELHNWEHHLIQFKNLFPYVKRDTELLKELNLDFQIKENVKTPEEIIDELIILLQNQRGYNAIQSELDNEVVAHFIENLLQSFIAQNFFYKICLLFDNVQSKNGNTIPNIKAIKYHELIDKAPMSKVGDHVMHINYGGGYGQSMASSCNNEFYFKLKKCCKANSSILESSKEDLFSNIDKLSLGIEYLIISVNISFSYEIKDTNAKFVSLNFLDEKLDHPSFEGNYDHTPVLTLHDRSLPKSVFVIHKDSLPEIIDYKFDHPDGLERIDNALYFVANNLSNDELLNNYKEGVEGDIGYSDDQIRKFVEIRLENYSEVDESNFKNGTMIIIKE